MIFTMGFRGGHSRASVPGFDPRLPAGHCWRESALPRDAPPSAGPSTPSTGKAGRGWTPAKDPERTNSHSNSPYPTPYRGGGQIMRLPSCRIKSHNVAHFWLFLHLARSHNLSPPALSHPLHPRLKLTPTGIPPTLLVPLSHSVDFFPVRAQLNITAHLAQIRIFASTHHPDPVLLLVRFVSPTLRWPQPVP